MRARGVPSIVRTEERSTLNERAGRVVLAYLRLALNARDHLAWRTVFAEGLLGVGAEGIAALHAVSTSNTDLPLADVIERVGADPTLVGGRAPAIIKAIATVRALVDTITTAIAAVGADVEQQITAVLATFGANPDLVEVEGELQSLRIAYSPNDLSDLLSQIALRREEEEAITPASVNIMSMHKAKGLDACVVIVTAAEEELIPGRNDRSEERRLFYVSLTRARHALFMTHTRQRFGQQARSGIGDPRHHNRTSFLDSAALGSDAGPAFVAGFTPDLDLLTPLPNPATAAGTAAS